jgi:hypothetical protein
VPASAPWCRRRGSSRPQRRARRWPPPHGPAARLPGLPSRTASRDPAPVLQARRSRSGDTAASDRRISPPAGCANVAGPPARPCPSRVSVVCGGPGRAAWGIAGAGGCVIASQAVQIYFGRMWRIT